MPPLDTLTSRLRPPPLLLSPPVLLNFLLLLPFLTPSAHELVGKGSFGTGDLALTVTVRYPAERLQKSGSGIDGGISMDDAGLYLRGGLAATGAALCGLNWDKGLRLEQISSSEWRHSLSCALATIENSKTLEMKVLVNDQIWSMGSNHRVDLVNVTTAVITPWFEETTGVLQIIPRIASKELGNERDVIVYVPPGYTENEHLVPSSVLIMHDGQNLFNPETAFMGQAWMVQYTTNPLIVEGKMEPILIIGVYNAGAARTDEYTNCFDSDEQAGGKADIYLDFLESTILPLISSKFRTPNISPQTLGILGSSLGGLLSCYAAATRPDVYGRAGCMSPSFWWSNEDFKSNIVPKAPDATSSRAPIYYLDSGDQGGDASSIEQPTIAVRDRLRQSKGYTINEDLYYYLDQGGDHNEKFWGARFPVPMLSLYGLDN